MSEKKVSSIEFEEEEKEEQVSTDINPQEINKEPEVYARKIASDRADSYDQMAGFSVPRDFVMLPSKGMIYPEGSPLHNMEEV